MTWRHPDDIAVQELCERARTAPEDVQRRVWGELQRYRREVLAAIKDGDNETEKDIIYCLVRGRFLFRLRAVMASAEPPLPEPGTDAS